MSIKIQIVVGLVAVGTTLGCNILELPEGNQNANQQWRFDLLQSSDSPVFATSTRSCRSGGSCATTNDPFIWTLLRTESFGCRFDYAFQVQFSGDQIRILLGDSGPASDCAGMSLGTNFGTGNADAAYPSARVGSGNVTINLDSPAGASGGTFFFRATRVQ